MHLIKHLPMTVTGLRGYGHEAIIHEKAASAPGEVDPAVCHVK
ncbi:MAG: hypothetical protein ACLTLQ_09570 [[Clostridium] scindens]